MFYYIKDKQQGKQQNYYKSKFAVVFSKADLCNRKQVNTQSL